VTDGAASASGPAGCINFPCKPAANSERSGLSTRALNPARSELSVASRKCYTALEVLPCGSKGALSVLRARWSFIMTITGETIIQISFLPGGTPTFKLRGPKLSEPDFPSILIALVAARDSRAASPIRVLIRRAQHPEPRTAPRQSALLASSLRGPRTSPACHAGSSLGIIPVSTGPLPFVQCFHI
jgi:hypothetical protein